MTYKPILYIQEKLVCLIDWGGGGGGGLFKNNLGNRLGIYLWRMSYLRLYNI